ncbi:MAG: hypothetical protein WC804_12695 [Sphingomonas sp.]|uniref:hypothetical protein n=1 Tax=Sphingomonas sp. TaxID=28214 RepID=UPI00356745F3
MPGPERFQPGWIPGQNPRIGFQVMMRGDSRSEKKGWDADVEPFSISGMKIVRVFLLSLLAILFAFLAVGSVMTPFVAALPIGLIFAALSLSSIGVALQAVFKRPI